jgi:hypothetical protein
MHLLAMAYEIEYDEQKGKGKKVEINKIPYLNR